MKIPYSLSLCLVILLAAVLSRCKKEASAGPNAPAINMPIETQTAAVYPDGGVTLNGEVRKVPADVSEYGFVLSTDSLVRYFQRYPTIGNIALGAFKVNINTGLQKNTKYYYAAYSMTAGSPAVTVYNIKSFNSAGSKKIQIRSISALKGDFGDTLTIKGKYFQGQMINVAFGKSYSSASILSDSVLTCIVPVMEQLSSLVTIQSGVVTDTVTNQFVLNAPVISSFTALATFRDTVLITGDHFGNQNSPPQVSLNGVAAVVAASTRKQIKVIVPDNLPNSFNTLILKAQLQTVSPSTQFQVRLPVITSVTASGNVNDPVVITGKYFHPVSYMNTVTSENIPVQITGGGSNQLDYAIPNGPYPRRKATIRLKLLDYTVTYTMDMLIKDKWVITSKVPFNDTDAPGAFTINGVSYVMAPSQDFSNYQQYLWKFNVSDYSWQQVSLPFSAVNGGKVVCNGIKAYFYQFTGSANFWEFDGATWRQKTDYPAGIRQYGAMFAIGTKVYLGLGSSSQTTGNPDTDDSFYEYDITADSWRRIADFPDPAYYGLRNRASAFVIGNTGYVACGSSNTGMYKCFSYSPALGTWSAIADFPDVRAYTTGFSFGNYGFISNGDWGTPTHDCFKYNPVSNTWTQLPDYIGCNACGWGIERGFAFVNGGNIYVGGGNSSSSSFYLYQAVGSGL